MIVNKPYTNAQYANLAVYCNENNCHIEDKGDYLESVENPPYVPTYEEQRQARANAYAVEVDPITAHIQRLRDQSPIPEGEIADLIAERDAKIQEIKEKYPYQGRDNNSSPKGRCENEIL